MSSQLERNRHSDLLFWAPSVPKECKSLFHHNFCFPPDWTGQSRRWSVEETDSFASRHKEVILITHLTSNKYILLSSESWVPQLSVETRQDICGHTSSLVSAAIQQFLPTTSTSNHTAIPTSDSICTNYILSVLRNFKFMSKPMSVMDQKLI